VETTKKILVADDDPIIIKLLQVNLEMEGYEVVCARDGQDAVDKAQAELPDLIILDIMMPRLDGWSARAALLEIPALRDTPVIFLSARAQQADLRKGYEAGVAEYVTKPFDPMDLLTMIEGILASKSNDAPGPDDTRPDAATPGDRSPDDRWPDDASLDEASANPTHGRGDTPGPSGATPTGGSPGDTPDQGGTPGPGAATPTGRRPDDTSSTAGTPGPNAARSADTPGPNSGGPSDTSSSAPGRPSDSPGPNDPARGDAGLGETWRRSDTPGPNDAVAE
jgi:CheY-like chemotaxis protein